MADDDLFGSDDDVAPPSMEVDKPGAGGGAKYDDLFGDDDEGGKGGEGAVDTFDFLGGGDDEDMLSSKPAFLPPVKKHVKTSSSLSLPPHVPGPLAAEDANTTNAILAGGKVPIFYMQPRPFDKDAYDPVEEDLMLMSKDASTEGGTLAPGQVIRWRYKTNSLGEQVMGADGKPVRESNARFVKWSDGVLQLVVGDEVFECTMNRRPTQHLYNLVQNDPAAALPDGALPISTDTTVFECVTTELHGLKVQPSSLNSKLHAAKAAANKQKYGKRMKIVQNHGDDPRDYLNPEVVKARQIKAETALRKREAKQLRGGGGGGGAGYGRPGMNSSFLDEDEADGNAQFDGPSLKAIKAAARAGKTLPAANKDSGEDMLDFIVGDDDDDESEGDDDWEASKKRKVARGASVLDSDDDDDDDNDDDEEEEEEEEEEGAGDGDDDAPSAKKKQRTIVDSDEDDE